MAYTSVSVLNYNSSPPSDDGSTESTNQITWAGIKSKLGDPLKTAIESINTGVDTALAEMEVDIAAIDAEVTSSLSGFDASLSAGVFDTGTAMLYKQSAAPTGWTKLTDSATYNNKCLRIVTGTAGTGGSTVFTDVFKARTILQANLPSYNLSHTLAVGSNVIASSAGTVYAVGATVNMREGTGDLTNNIAANVSGTTLTLYSTALSGSIPLGGSGTAMDFAVAYVDVIAATKDAP